LATLIQHIRTFESELGVTISVVAPVYNEEVVIHEFYSRLSSVLKAMPTKSYELIFVNDGSRDRTLVILKDIAQGDSCVKVIDLRKNYGQTAALQCGIDSALGQIIVTMDSDLQHFPEEIPNFVAKMEEGFDIVCGWRSERAEGYIRRWPSLWANLLIRWISGLDLHDFGTTFRSYRSEVAKDIRLYGEFHRFVPVMGLIVGARIAELPIRNIERPVGKSNYGIGRTFGVCLDLIIVNFFVKHMDRPMRFFGAIGTFMLVSGFAILTVLFVLSYVYGVSMVKERVGWFVLSSLLLLGAVQSIFTGILGEILIRIRFELGNDRVYQIRKVYGRDV